MQIASWKFWGSIVASFILGWGLSHISQARSIGLQDKNVATVQSATPSQEKHDPYTSQPSKIPPYVLETLEYILEHNEAPSGYVGGRIFQNREGLLPKTSAKGHTYEYREWDVHPRVHGQNRGPERLVTSDERDAYFTADHYKSFQKIN